MKKFFYLATAVLALLAAPAARAWSYTDGDALLIFRAAGHNDVEFDLGSINQFLNHASGYTASVTNWTLAPVTNEFGSDLTGVSVLLLAVTPIDSVTYASDTAWVSSADTVSSVADFTFSAWSGKLHNSTINSIGSKPPTYLPATANNWYSIPLSSPAAYDTIVVAGGGPVNQLGGNVAFSVEEIIPGTLKLWAIQPSTVTPKPAAAFVGSFNVTAAGGLHFTAGSVAVQTPPVITGVTRASGVNAITFTTTSGGTYQLHYTNVLSGSVSNWPAVGVTVAGDGSNKTLSHTNATAAGFYGVSRSP